MIPFTPPAWASFKNVRRLNPLIAFALGSVWTLPSGAQVRVLASPIEDRYPISSKTSDSTGRSLQYYLEQGQQNSPLLKENGNLILSSRIDSSRFRATQRPQVALASVAQVYPSIAGFAYNQSVTNGGNYLATVNVSQPLFNRFEVRTTLNGNRLRRDSLINTGLLSRQDLKRAIINQYILAYSDQKQVQFQSEVLRVYTGQELIFKKLVQGGLFKQSDYLTFLVSRQAQEITVTQSRVSFHNNLSLLNLVCGIADTTSLHLADPAIVQNELRPVSSTFQFKRYLLDSLAIVQQRALVSVAYRPKITWFANAGYISPTFNQFYRSLGVSGGLTFNIPLYDGHQRQYATRQLDLSEKSRQGYAGFFKTQFAQQILLLKKQLRDNEDLQRQVRAQLKNGELLIDIDRKLLNLGDLKINDLILALNSYRVTRFTLAQLEVNQLTIINQLNYWSYTY